MKPIEITNSAERELKNLPKEIRAQVVQKIKLLAGDPFPPNSKKLKGGIGYRIRSGDYRVIYMLAGDTIKILAIGNRKDVYR